MPESAARQHLRETREKAAAKREAAEGRRPSMFRTAVEAAAGVLPDAPAATGEKVALAVLRVALPLHETQHADAWKAAHERAVHFEWELTKCAEVLGHLVDHEDQPCRFDHHGACQEHGGSSLRRRPLSGRWVRRADQPSVLRGLPPPAPCPGRRLFHAVISSARSSDHAGERATMRSGAGNGSSA